MSKGRQIHTGALSPDRIPAPLINGVIPLINGSLGPSLSGAILADGCLPIPAKELISFCYRSWRLLAAGKDKCTQQGPGLAGVEGRHSGYSLGKAAMDLDGIQVVNMKIPWGWTCTLHPASSKETSLLTAYRRREPGQEKWWEVSDSIRIFVSELSLPP